MDGRDGWMWVENGSDGVDTDDEEKRDEEGWL
jgi:hypothetical protein